jgi:Mg2+ and Co2+ transporter CorA
MNIDLPLDDHPDAFWIIAGSLMVIAIVMLTYFKRRKWI